MNDEQTKKSLWIAWGFLFATWAWVALIVSITGIVLGVLAGYLGVLAGVIQSHNANAFGEIVGEAVTVVFSISGSALGGWSAFNYWGGTADGRVSVMSHYVRWCLARPWVFLIPGWFSAVFVFAALGALTLFGAWTVTVDLFAHSQVILISVGTVAEAVVCIKAGRRLRREKQGQ